MVAFQELRLVEAIRLRLADFLGGEAGVAALAATASAVNAWYYVASDQMPGTTSPQTRCLEVVFKIVMQLQNNQPPHMYAGDIYRLQRTSWSLVEATDYVDIKVLSSKDMKAKRARRVRCCRHIPGDEEWSSSGYEDEEYVPRHRTLIIQEAYDRLCEANSFEAAFEI